MKHRVVARVRPDGDALRSEQPQLVPVEQCLTGERRVDLRPALVGQKRSRAQEDIFDVGLGQRPQQLGRVSGRSFPIVGGAKLERPPPLGQLDARLFREREGAARMTYVGTREPESIRPDGTNTAYGRPLSSGSASSSAEL